jgi:hypothetical protein
MRRHHVNRGCRRDIVARLGIHRRAGEPLKLVELAPRVGLGEAAAHGHQDGQTSERFNTRPASRAGVGKGVGKLVASCRNARATAILLLY